MIEGGFLDPEPGLGNIETAGALVLPLPLDLTCSWKRGTGGGPAAIIEASHHIEYYDEEVGFDACAALGGIATHAEPDLPTDPAEAAGAVEELAAGLLKPGRLLVSLGGEHSLSHPLVAAHLRRWPGLSVLQIDAHADLRESYQGSPHNHACPMRRIMELGVHVTAVAIRSVDESEVELMDGELRRTFWAHEVCGRLDDHIDAIVDSLPGDDVYITIDLDGLDPSVVPAVGTPIPGGLGWYETLRLLRALFAKKSVVGVDVVELSPRDDQQSADSAAARLVYKMMAYRAERLRWEHKID